MCWESLTVGVVTLVRLVVSIAACIETCDFQTVKRFGEEVSATVADHVVHTALLKTELAIALLEDGLNHLVFRRDIVTAGYESFQTDTLTDSIHVRDCFTDMSCLRQCLSIDEVHLGHAEIRPREVVVLRVGLVHIEFVVGHTGSILSTLILGRLIVTSVPALYLVTTHVTVDIHAVEGTVDDHRLIEARVTGELTGFTLVDEHRVEVTVLLKVIIVELTSVFPVELLHVVLCRGVTTVAVPVGPEILPALRVLSTGTRGDEHLGGTTGRISLTESSAVTARSLSGRLYESVDVTILCIGVEECLAGIDDSLPAALLIVTVPRLVVGVGCLVTFSAVRLTVVKQRRSGIAEDLSLQTHGASLCEATFPVALIVTE